MVGGGAKRFDGIRDGDYAKLGAALDKVKAHRRGARPARPLPPAPLDHRRRARPRSRRIFGLTSIDFCPDTAHLAAAGGDPAALVRELAARITYVHLKGLQREPFAFTPLDRGDVPTGRDPRRAARDRASRAGSAPNSMPGPTPPKGPRVSMEYLDRN